MMFFEYNKKTKISSLLIASIYSCAFGVLLGFISSFVIQYLLNYINSFNVQIISIVIGAICFLGFELAFLFSKKGVYVADDRLILKNGYRETGRGAFVNFQNDILYKDILDVEFLERYEPLSSIQEKFIGKCIKDCHYVVLTINSEPYNILLYISVENEIEFCKLLEQHIEL